MGTIRLKRGTAPNASPGALDDGEVAINEFDGKLFYKARPAGTVTAIPLVPTPVLSVAGRNGHVVIGKGDIGLGNVDNTADVAKPVSTATQSALASRLRVDAAQGLTGGQQSQGRSNLGLGDMATQSQTMYVPKPGGQYTGLVRCHATGSDAGFEVMSTIANRPFRMLARDDGGGFVITDEVAGAERIIIDVGGRVLIPGLPAFAAFRSAGWETLTANGQYGTLNGAGEFAMNRGGFFAGGSLGGGGKVVHVPASGIYMITLSAYVAAGSAGRLEVIKNGTGCGFLIEFGMASTERLVSKTAPVLMNSNDWLGMVVGPNGNVNVYTAFGHTGMTGVFMG